MTTQTDEPRKMPGVLISVVTLLGTVVFMGAFMATYQALGVGVPYVGLFFLLYWAAMLHQDPAQYLPTVLGGLVGIGLAWLLMALPPLYGQAGFYGSYAALGLVLFCYIRGQALYFVNNGTMLFVQLAVIPELNVRANVIAMGQSLVLAAIFMGIVALGLRQVQTIMAKRAAG